MFLVIHKNDKLKLIHVSTHHDGILPSQCSTKSYVTRARWAMENHKTKLSALHNFHDGFQLALITSGLNATDWNDTRIHSENYRKDREEILAEHEGAGYTNVGSTREHTVRVLAKSSGLGYTSEWAKKEYNPTRYMFDKSFGKMKIVLEAQGYSVPESLLTRIYFNLTKYGSGMKTKADAVEYMLNEIGYME